MRTVAITDYSFPDLDLERLVPSADGFELGSGNNSESAALQTLVAEADALIMQFASIDAEAVGAIQQTKVIVLYSIGVDNVDVEAVRAVIYVCCPELVPTDSPQRSLPGIIVASHIAPESPRIVRSLRETADHIASWPCEANCCRTL